LIGKFQYPSTEHINAELKQLILERERITPSDDFANLGGWHSPSDFLEWPGNAVATLRSWISDNLGQMTAATYQLPEVQGRPMPGRGGFMVHAWANVSRRGNYHRMHNHPLFTLAIPMSRESPSHSMQTGNPNDQSDGSEAKAGDSVIAMLVSV